MPLLQLLLPASLALQSLLRVDAFAGAGVAGGQHRGRLRGRRIVHRWRRRRYRPVVPTGFNRRQNCRGVRR